MSRFNDGHPMSDGYSNHNNNYNNNAGYHPGHPASNNYNNAGYPAASDGYHNAGHPAASTGYSNNAGGYPAASDGYNNAGYPAGGYAADSSEEGAPYNYDKEKGFPVSSDPVPTDGASSDFADIDPDSGVKRALKTRHLSMMALAGIIGPGLLVGAGGALAKGGPASLLIGFGVIGIIAFFIMQSLGELTTLYPTGGAFTGLADRFVDRAFGCALGWNYFIIWFCVLANEYNVICSVFVQWGPQVPLWGYFLIFWVSRGVFPWNLFTDTSDCFPPVPAARCRGLWRGRVLAR